MLRSIDDLVSPGGMRILRVLLHNQLILNPCYEFNGLFAFRD
jgi:hypothetical protein